MSGRSHRVPAGPAPTVASLPAAGGMGYVGLDVSQAEVVACVLLPDGREASRRWSVANTQPGAEHLAQRVAALATEHHLAGLRIGLEATNTDWWHLACLLKDTPLLAGMPHEVYALNPKLVAGLKGAYSDGGKTDRRAAFFIAERLRIGRLPAPFQVDVLYAPLQRLTRFRAHLAHTLVREKNYFLNMLFLKFSAFSTSEAFGDPFGAASVAVLEGFSTEELIQLPLEELARFIQEQGHGRFADPAEVATTLARAARDSYRLDRVLDEPVTLVLGTAMATIRTLQAQLKEVDKTIARELKAGNAYLRYYLVEAANSVRLHCAEYRDFYAAKLAQSPKHAHKRALVLTARKLVRLVDALLRAGAIYQPQDRKEGQTRPHTAHPRPQQRARLVASAS